MASKGQKYKQWTAEEKYKIIKPALDFEKKHKSSYKRNRYKQWNDK